MANPQEILDTFAKLRWQYNPFDDLFETIRADAMDAFRLLEMALARGHDRQTFLDAAISHVPEEMLDELARLAVVTFLRNPKNEVATDIIDYLALQKVTSLRPFLDSLSYAIPNQETCSSFWPWRGADSVQVELQLELLQSTTDAKQTRESFQRILHSRIPEYVSKALEVVQKDRLTCDKAIYLQEVGFDVGLRPLFSTVTYHLKYPFTDADKKSTPPWLSIDHHPSWNLSATGDKHRFGGTVDATCPLCQESLHQVILLDPVPTDIGLGLPNRLQVVTCLSCLGWTKAPLCFEHDDAGTASPIYAGLEKPQFPAKPFREAWVELCRTPPRWQWQDWASSNARENLHRIGGHPTWVQYGEYPACPKCDAFMVYFMQLNSRLPTQANTQWLWGSGGICYFFWCANCRVSAAFWQCT
jgi:hypothetical protein